MSTTCPSVSVALCWLPWYPITPGYQAGACQFQVFHEHVSRQRRYRTAHGCAKPLSNRESKKKNFSDVWLPFHYLWPILLIKMFLRKILFQLGDRDVRQSSKAKHLSQRWNLHCCKAKHLKKYRWNYIIIIIKHTKCFLCYPHDPWKDNNMGYIVQCTCIYDMIDLRYSLSLSPTRIVRSIGQVLPSQNLPVKSS